MENEVEKLAPLLMGMVEGVEETDPNVIYQPGFCAEDGDVFVARAAALLREQAVRIEKMEKKLKEHFVNRDYPYAPDVVRCSLCGDPVFAGEKINHYDTCVLKQ